MRSGLTDIYAPVCRELEAATEWLTRELESCPPRLAELLGDSASLPGKRLRPALLLLCGQACGELTERHIRSAAIVELIHSATLIHDDVIDDAARRRRRATARARWGDDVSIMLGDLSVEEGLAKGVAATEDLLDSLGY